MCGCVFPLILIPSSGRVGGGFKTLTQSQNRISPQNSQPPSISRSIAAELPHGAEGLLYRNDLHRALGSNRRRPAIACSACRCSRVRCKTRRPSPLRTHTNTISLTQTNALLLSLPGATACCGKSECKNNNKARAHDRAQKKKGRPRQPRNKQKQSTSITQMCCVPLATHTPRALIHTSFPTLPLSCRDRRRVCVVFTMGMIFSVSILPHLRLTKPHSHAIRLLLKFKSDKKKTLQKTYHKLRSALTEWRTSRLTRRRR